MGNSIVKAEEARLVKEAHKEELVSEINACYKTFDRIIEKRGAEKIKTIGDAVNTASRMEKHSEVGKVSVSQATFE